MHSGVKVCRVRQGDAGVVPGFEGGGRGDGEGVQGGGGVLVVAVGWWERRVDRVLYLGLFGWSLVFLVGGWSGEVRGEGVEGGRELGGGVLRVEIGVAWGVVGDFLRGDGLEGVSARG